MRFLSPTQRSLPYVVLVISALTACASSPAPKPAICDTPIPLTIPYVAEFENVSFIDTATLRVTAWGYTRTPPKTDEWRVFHVNIADGRFAEVPRSAFVPLRDPCTGSCSIDIVDASPDKNWQLANVKSKSSRWGVWLLSREQQFKLTDPGYTPKWQWSDDSTRLWFSVGFPDGYGINPRMVFLDTPVFTRTMPLTLIADDDSKVVFNPVSKMVETISFTYGISLPLTSPQTLQSLTVQTSTVTVSERRRVDGLARVSWDVGRRMLLLTAIDDDGLNITTRDGMLLAHIPRAIFERKEIPFKDFFRFGGYEGVTLSGDGSVLAMLSGSDVVAYRCRKE